MDISGPGSGTWRTANDWFEAYTLALLDDLARCFDLGHPKVWNCLLPLTLGIPPAEVTRWTPPVALLDAAMGRSAVDIAPRDLSQD